MEEEKKEETLKPVRFKKGKEQAAVLFVKLKGRKNTTILRSEKGIFTIMEKTPIAYMRKLGYEELKS